MTDKRDTTEDLEADIAMGLADSPFRSKRQGLGELRLVARTVVEHLRMSRWTFSRRPPEEPQSAGGQPAPSSDRKKIR